jgi:hypothetical protein
MKSDAITNENVIATDYSRTERCQFILAIPRENITDQNTTRRNFVNDLFRQDISARDRRSVKAQLVGRGDYRTSWWDFHCWVSRLLQRESSLEQQMFDFHQRHHRWTIAYITLSQHLRDLDQRIRHQGIFGSVPSVTSALIKTLRRVPGGSND